MRVGARGRVCVFRCVYIRACVRAERLCVFIILCFLYLSRRDTPISQMHIQRPIKFIIPGNDRSVQDLTKDSIASQAIISLIYPNRLLDR